MRRFVMFIIAVVFAFSACASATNSEKGAGWGAAIGTIAGAGLGYAIGGKKGMAIGAGTGLVVGTISGMSIGTYMDNQEQELRDAFNAAESASIRRDQEVLELTFKSDIMFDVDSSIIKPGAYSELDRVSDILNKYYQTNVRIEGHTDSTGSETYNLDLSEKRANAVKNALIARGVSSSRLITIGFGMSQPVADNQTEAGRQLNRRVTMRIAPIG